MIRCGLRDLDFEPRASVAERPGVGGEGSFGDAFVRGDVADEFEECGDSTLQGGVGVEALVNEKPDGNPGGVNGLGCGRLERVEECGIDNVAEELEGLLEVGGGGIRTGSGWGRGHGAPQGGIIPPRRKRHAEVSGVRKKW